MDGTTAANPMNAEMVSLQSATATTVNNSLDTNPNSKQNCNSNMVTFYKLYWYHIR